MPPRILNAFLLGEPTYNGPASSATCICVLSGASQLEQTLVFDDWEEADLRQALAGLASLSEAEYRLGHPAPISPRYAGRPA